MRNRVGRTMLGSAMRPEENITMAGKIRPLINYKDGWEYTYPEGWKIVTGFIELAYAFKEKGLKACCL